MSKMSTAAVARAPGGVLVRIQAALNRLDFADINAAFGKSVADRASKPRARDALAQIHR